MKTKYIFLITGLRSIEAYIKISKKKFYLKFVLPAPYLYSHFNMQHKKFQWKDAFIQNLRNLLELRDISILL